MEQRASDPNLPSRHTNILALGAHALLVRLVEVWMGSCRAQVIDPHNAGRYFQEGSPVIIALWHAHLIYTLFHFRRWPGVIMVSGSSDGEWVARTVKRWGQTPLRGSRHKGGLKAVRDMAEIMRQKRCHAGIVADGSKGPAHVAQKGAIILARDTGFPIIPTGFAAQPAWRFNSWDRTILPMPLARVVMVYGKPIYVPGDARGGVTEEYRQSLETALNEATQAAEEALLTR